MTAEKPLFQSPLDPLVEWVRPGLEPVSGAVDLISGLFPPGVVAFQTHRGDVASKGPYASFNLAAHVGDRQDSVHQNRRELEKCCATKPVWLQQTHGAGVLELDSPADLETAELSADAALTGRAGRACTVMTADCLPILVALTRARCVLAIHAGWRGLAAGVIQAGLQAAARRQQGPDQWSIWLGPCIGPDSYEVGAEVREVFLGIDGQAESAFRPSQITAGKFYADLRALALHRILGWFELHPDFLLTGGSESHSADRPIRIGLNSECTYRDEGRYYSFRRHSVSGRMASLIALKPI
ncbi:MAG: laccase domain-containing protein [Betaproteobacteria bacterium]|nr:laccase domain-containing protein [Betaproteobacteria bacterium]